MRTFTGKSVNVFNPKPEMFDIIDIAHGLSKEQRFGNQLAMNYCVAQHSIICCEMAPIENKLTALMHDAAETYLRDLAKPIKLKLSEYSEIENIIMECLSDKFGFQYPLPDRVKEIDDFMLKREWNALMLRNEPFGDALMSRTAAKKTFLKMFKELSLS